MPPFAIIAGYVALATLDLCWALFLTLLNYRHVAARAGTVPGPLAESVSAEEAAKAASYSLAKMRFSFVQAPIVTAITVAAAALGLFGLLDRAESALVAGAYWRGALFLGSVALAQGLLSIPFELYSTFSLEKRFGFNTTSPRTWLLDLAKSAGLAIVLGLPLLYLLYVFIDGTGGLWWLWAATAYALINLLISLIYPLVIAPLFNKFSPLSEGSLAAKIGELARRLDFKVGGVFVMDSSKRSRHSNAYFTGLGRVKRVVLYDTLVSGAPEEEILAILAHEIGHEKRKHVQKATVASIAFSFLIFWVMSLMMKWQSLYAAFGFAQASKHAILLILSLVAGPATFFIAPAFSAWSRSREYQADKFAVEALASGASAADKFAVEALASGAIAADAAQAVRGRALASALLRLNRENASNLWPHRLYSAWYYSHPALVERLAAIAEADGLSSQKA
jgi:STE24 endopeptidase